MSPSESPASIEELLGRRIWQLRRARKLSQEQLAEASGINASFLGCVERGQKCPTVRVLEKIRRALGVSYMDLFDFSDQLQEGEKMRLQERFSRLLHLLPSEDLELLDGLLEVLERKRGHRPQ